MNRSILFISLSARPIRERPIDSQIELIEKHSITIINIKTSITSISILLISHFAPLEISISADAVGVCAKYMHEPSHATNPWSISITATRKYFDVEIN